MTGAVVAALKARELDWGLIAEDTQDPALTAHALFEEPFYAALPGDHPLASHEAVAQSALCTERVLVLGEGHCLRDQTRLLCKVPMGTSDDIQATSLETLRGLVAAGQGVTLIPALARREAEVDIVLRPLLPAASRSIVLVTRRADPRREEAALLADTLRNAAPGGVKVDRRIR